MTKKLSEQPLSELIAMAEALTLVISEKENQNAITYEGQLPDEVRKEFLALRALYPRVIESMNEKLKEFI